MSEIVYASRIEMRHSLDYITYGRTQTDRKITIFKSPGKVAVVNSSLIAGIPRSAPDKRYFYWRSIASSGFRRNKAGTIVPFSCTRPWDAKVGTPWRHKFPNEPFNWLTRAPEDGDDDAGRIFQHAVWDEFGFRDANELYPMLDKYELPSYFTIPNTLKMPFRTDDWEDFTSRVFGKTRTSPKMIAAVRQTEPYVVAYAQQFRGLVPDGELIGCMYRNRFDEEMEENFQPHSPTIRHYLRHTSRSTCLALVRASLDFSDMRRIQRMTQLNKRDMARYATMNNPVNNWSDVVR